MMVFEYCRGSVDGGGAQAVPAGIAEGRERRLERNIEKLREDSHANAGCKPCSEHHHRYGTFYFSILFLSLFWLLRKRKEKKKRISVSETVCMVFLFL